jgi:anti-anti-sigma factor
VSSQADEHDGLPLLQLSEELDAAAGNDLSAVAAGFERRGDFLILDLRDVGYMDSTALGVLIGLHVRLSERSGAVAIVHGSTGLGRLFDVAGLNRTLNTFGNLDDAAGFLESLRDSKTS